MFYCANCGREITEGADFCTVCGAPVKLTPVVMSEELRTEESAFLETSHRLLRWEHKAWSITSKVYIAVGIVFTALFLLFALLLATLAPGGASYNLTEIVFSVIYGIVYGTMFTVAGIICKKACGKITQYTNTVYTDFSLTYNRCGSVGMLVFTAIFGTVPSVFFIINFARMKANKALIEQIIMNQNHS